MRMIRIHVHACMHARARARAELQSRHGKCANGRGARPSSAAGGVRERSERGVKVYDAVESLYRRPIRRARPAANGDGDSGGLEGARNRAAIDRSVQF